MKWVTLQVDEKKLSFFLELIQNLEFVKVDEEEVNALNELAESLTQVKLMKEAKLPKKTAKEFLSEL